VRNAEVTTRVCSMVRSTCVVERKSMLYTMDTVVPGTV
jgi:hypothetical protein